MLDFICKACNKILQEDTVRTFTYYNSEIKTIFMEDGSLDKNVYPEFIVYSCHSCGYTVRVLIEQLIKTKQEFIIQQILNLRLGHSISTSRTYNIEEASGIGYCGVCPGILDGDGYCSNDLILKCTTRREILAN